MTPIFENGSAVELVRDPGSAAPTVVGWGFASKGDPSRGEADQVQRWVLRGTSVEKARENWASNTNTVLFRRPKTAPWDKVNENQFITEATKLVQAKTHVYAKANCALIGGTASLPKPIPVPSDLKPPPGTGSQIDVGIVQLRPWPASFGDFPVGYIGTFQQSTHRFHEYWALFPNYVPVNKTSWDGVFVGPTKYPSEFGELFDNVQWSTACTMVVCNIGYYDKMPVPA